ELKEKGNKCVKDKKYEEAILHYTHAVKLDSTNYSLYSNRSLAFLKVKQYYHAYQDALETIRLKPDWAKGYFRKGEVESATFQYSDALLSYHGALQLLPGDETLLEAIKQTTLLMQKHKKNNEQVPWLGAGIGIIAGVAIVVADQVFTVTPSINHPILMALLTISVAVLGFGMAKGYAYFINCQQKGLLDAPVEMINKGDNPVSNGKEKDKLPGSNHHRYTKAQSRLRLKKGKT
ncbi:hypothetical protein AAG570_004190, partial [Ranatra chinensis]